MLPLIYFLALSGSTAASVEKRNVFERDTCSCDDLVTKFWNDPSHGQAASSAIAPVGYAGTGFNGQVWTSGSGFLGHVSIPEYDSDICGALCDQSDVCSSFQIYFELDSDTPKCAFWSGSVPQVGNYSSNQHATVAGCNSYQKNSTITSDNNHNGDGKSSAGQHEWSDVSIGSGAHSTIKGSDPAASSKSHPVTASNSDHEWSNVNFGSGSHTSSSSGDPTESPSAASTEWADVSLGGGSYTGSWTSTDGHSSTRTASRPYGTSVPDGHDGDGIDNGGHYRPSGTNSNGDHGSHPTGHPTGANPVSTSTSSGLKPASTTSTSAGSGPVNSPPGDNNGHPTSTSSTTSGVDGHGPAPTPTSTSTSTTTSAHGNGPAPAGTTTTSLPPNGQGSGPVVTTSTSTSSSTSGNGPAPASTTTTSSAGNHGPDPVTTSTTTSGGPAPAGVTTSTTTSAHGDGPAPVSTTTTTTTTSSIVGDGPAPAATSTTSTTSTTTSSAIGNDPAFASTTTTTTTSSADDGGPANPAPTTTTSSIDGEGPNAPVYTTTTTTTTSAYFPFSTTSSVSTSYYGGPGIFFSTTTSSFADDGASTTTSSATSSATTSSTSSAAFSVPTDFIINFSPSGDLGNGRKVRRDSGGEYLALDTTSNPVSVVIVNDAADASFFSITSDGKLTSNGYYFQITQAGLQVAPTAAEATTGWSGDLSGTLTYSDANTNSVSNFCSTGSQVLAYPSTGLAPSGCSSVQAKIVPSGSNPSTPSTTTTSSSTTSLTTTSSSTVSTSTTSDSTTSSSTTSSSTTTDSTTSTTTGSTSTTTTDSTTSTTTGSTSTTTTGSTSSTSTTTTGSTTSTSTGSTTSTTTGSTSTTTTDSTTSTTSTTTGSTSTTTTDSTSSTSTTTTGSTTSSTTGSTTSTTTGSTTSSTTGSTTSTTTGSTSTTTTDSTSSTSTTTTGSTTSTSTGSTTSTTTGSTSTTTTGSTSTTTTGSATSTTTGSTTSTTTGSTTSSTTGSTTSTTTGSTTSSTTGSTTSTTTTSSTSTSKTSSSTTTTTTGSTSSTTSSTTTTSTKSTTTSTKSTTSSTTSTTSPSTSSSTTTKSGSTTTATTTTTTKGGSSTTSTSTTKTSSTTSSGKTTTTTSTSSTTSAAATAAPVSNYTTGGNSSAYGSALNFTTGGNSSAYGSALNFTQAFNLTQYGFNSSSILAWNTSNWNSNTTYALAAAAIINNQHLEPFCSSLLHYTTATVTKYTPVTTTAKVNATISKGTLTYLTNTTVTITTAFADPTWLNKRATPAANTAAITTPAALASYNDDTLSTACSWKATSPSVTLTVTATTMVTKNITSFATVPATTLTIIATSTSTVNPCEPTSPSQLIKNPSFECYYPGWQYVGATLYWGPNGTVAVNNTASASADDSYYLKMLSQFASGGAPNSSSTSDQSTASQKTKRDANVKRDASYTPYEPAADGSTYVRMSPPSGSTDALLIQQFDTPLSPGEYWVSFQYRVPAYAMNGVACSLTVGTDSNSYVTGVYGLGNATDGWASYGGFFTSSTTVNALVFDFYCPSYNPSSGSGNSKRSDHFDDSVDESLASVKEKRQDANSGTNPGSQYTDAQRAAYTATWTPASFNLPLLDLDYIRMGLDDGSWSQFYSGGGASGYFGGSAPLTSYCDPLGTTQVLQDGSFDCFNSANPNEWVLPSDGANVITDATAGGKDGSSYGQLVANPVNGWQFLYQNVNFSNGLYNLAFSYELTGASAIADGSCVFEAWTNTVTLFSTNVDTGLSAGWVDYSQSWQASPDDAYVVFAAYCPENQITANVDRVILSVSSGSSSSQTVAK